jgi:hypothetical protein
VDLNDVTQRKKLNPQQVVVGKAPQYVSPPHTPHAMLAASAVLLYRKMRGSVTLAHTIHFVLCII